MNTYHILHSEAATGWGGQEIRVFQECYFLLELGHRVTIICQPETPLAKRCSSLNHPRFRFHTTDMNGILSGLLRLYQLISSDRPDILHTHSSKDSWLVTICGLWLRIPIVRSRHVSIPIKNYFPRNWIYSSPNRIIASGSKIQKMIQKINGVSPQTVVSVPAGVDLKKFDYNCSGNLIREELKIGQNQILIGKIAVIRSWKGHDIFLDAIPMITEKYPNSRFLIVGQGPGFQEIKQKILNKGLNSKVFALGHREDIPNIMAAIDILVQASTSSEGTPQVIPQAFAMKVPIVGTRVGSIPELLGDGRGVLVKPSDPQALSLGVLKLLDKPNLGDEITKNAYNYCRKNQTIDQMMNKTIAVYESILK